MAIDPRLDPAPDAGAGFGAGYEWDDRAFEGPDDVGRVTEVADMIAVFTAERLVLIDRARRNALDEAQQYGGAVAAVVERSVRLELAAALRITEHDAAEMLGLAEALVHRYPAALRSLARAAITEKHARILVDTLDALEPHDRDPLLPHALEMAEQLPIGTFRRALRKLAEAVNSETLPERHEAASAGRRVVVEPARDGLGWLAVLLPLVEAHAIHGRVTAIAKVIAAQEGETRTLDQIRADVLADLLIDGETDLHPAGARGIRATVVVTVPALTLLNDEAPAGSEPATVEGVGPIPVERARELCGGAEGWMRILTHPETGAVLSVGRDQYRPPPGLRKIVKWRADRCMAPGCGMPASRCEIDHTIAWEHGGHTSLDNLAPICKGHHTLKHHGGWRVEQITGSGGALQWTSPSGRRYRVEPERPVPVFRPTTAADAPF